MAKKMSIKERILGSKKTRGLIIAGVLGCIAIYLISTDWAHGPIWGGVYGALGLTIAAIIKETFDIKQTWKLGFAIIIIGMITVAIISRWDIALTLSIPILIIMALVFFHTKKFGKKSDK